MSASSAAPALPPTGTEVLEGGMRDSANGEVKEVPGGHWGWPGGSTHRRSKFWADFWLLLHDRRGKTHKTPPQFDGLCINESKETLGRALRRREQKP